METVITIKPIFLGLNSKIVLKLPKSNSFNHVTEKMSWNPGMYRLIRDGWAACFPLCIPDGILCSADSGSNPIVSTLCIPPSSVLILIYSAGPYLCLFLCLSTSRPQACVLFGSSFNRSVHSLCLQCTCCSVAW